MLASFFQTGGAAQSGWTSYPPLAVIAPGQTMWLVGMIFADPASVTTDRAGHVHIFACRFFPDEGKCCKRGEAGLIA